MHTACIRLNVLIFFFLTILMLVGFVCTMSSIAFEPTIQPRISNVEVLALQHVRSPMINGDRAHFLFDLRADLRPLWNWNVKQLFVWIAAEYATPTRSKNIVSLWDRIITSKNESLIDVKRTLCDYSLFDTEHELRGTRLNFSLYWEVMPYVGFARRGGKPLRSPMHIQLPMSYVR